MTKYSIENKKKSGVTTSMNAKSIREGACSLPSETTSNYFIQLSRSGHDDLARSGHDMVFKSPSLRDQAVQNCGIRSRPMVISWILTASEMVAAILTDP